MLFVSAIGSAGGAAEYFGKDNYYSAEHGMLEAEWAGSGAAELGLNAGTPVTSQNLDAMLSGNLPDGTKLDYQGRRAGFDLTFSMPKSWSLIALVGGDARVMAAYRDAVRETMAWAEANLAATRVERDGKMVSEKTGNLAYALVPHDLNRNAEPQGHVHVVLANATKGLDGKWRALDARPFYERVTLLDTVANTLFREKVQALGYETVPTGKYGAVEAKGITREQIMAFSTRRQEVLAALDAKGHSIASAASDVAAKSTRADKEPDIDRGELLTQWRETAANVGLDLGSIIARAQDRERGGATVFDKMVEGVKGATDRMQAVALGLADLVGLSQRDRDQFIPEHKLSQWFMGRGEMAAATSVAAALRHLSERETSFSPLDVYQAALALGLPTSITAVQARLDKLMNKQVVLAGVGADGERITTHSSLAVEHAILAEAQGGERAAAPIVSMYDAGRRLQDHALATKGVALNPGQEAAGRIVLQSQDRIVQVQGVAGAGKSTMLAPLAAVLREEGRNIVGLGLQHKLVRDLEAGTGIGSTTIAKFIATHERLLDPQRTSPQKLALARAMFANSVIVVDESSMVGNAQQLTLSRLANHLGIDRLVMVGDVKQLSAIDAGKPNELMQRTGTETAVMPENLRARDPVVREAAALLQAGQAKAAVQTLGSKVQEHDNPAEAAAAAWLAKAPAEREGVGLLTSGRKYRNEVNQLVQQGRGAQGELGDGSMWVTVREQVNVTREETRHSVTYHDGQVIEITRGLTKFDIAKGEGQVIAVDHEHNIVKLVDAKGRTRELKLDKLQANMKDDAIRLYEQRVIELREQDQVRWTAHDRERGLLKADGATVIRADEHGVTVRTDVGVELTLERGDPMLKNVDLGYAMNAHPAQGVTHKETIAVVDPRERNLATARLFLVAATRTQGELTVMTTDAEKLANKLERTPGDKTSAMETMGQVPPIPSASPGGESGPTGRSPTPGPTPDPGGGSGGLDASARSSSAPSTLVTVPIVPVVTPTPAEQKPERERERDPAKERENAPEPQRAPTRHRQMEM